MKYHVFIIIDQAFFINCAAWTETGIEKLIFEGFWNFAKKTRLNFDECVEEKP